MDLFQRIFLFVAGLCVGSFINVVVYRLNHNLSPFKGRSICPKCKRKIRWHDNLPLVSFLALRGRCRHCHSPISWQYPLVEAACAILFLLIFFSYGLTWVSLLWAIIACVFIVLFAYDLLHAEIPVFLIWIGLVAALILILIDIYSSSGFIWVQALNYIYGALALGGFLGLLVLISWEKWMAWGIFG